MSEVLKSYRFIILVPFRNAGLYLIDCVNSIINQKYSNYEVYFLDDASEDHPEETVKEVLEIGKFHYMKREERIGALANLYQGLINIPFRDEDIVVILDGDDLLFGEYALQIINYKYQDNQTLLSYGSFMDIYGNTSDLRAYTEDEFKNLRRSPWLASHLKTFKYSLFKRFLKIDPTGKSLKDEQGHFYMSTYDMALMFPLMEIAGYDKCAFIPNVLYIYRLYSGNDHATTEGRTLQLEVEEMVRTSSSFVGK